MTATRCRVVMEGCGFEKMNAIEAGKVIEYIGRLREKKVGKTGTRTIGPQTLNYYLRACRQFTRWLWLNQRMNKNPLLHLTGWDAKQDRRHERRALSLQEIHSVLTNTKASTWDFRGLQPEDRYMLYALAIGSGLRRSELASVRPRDLRLDSHPPVVVVKAAYTKNGQEATQPIAEDLAAAFRDYLVGKPGNQPVWPGTWSERAYAMLKKDLKAAKIAYRDEEGRFADFHALRHTFITLLAKHNVPPKLAQSLARHSDINLTMSVYSHVGLYDQAAALAAVSAFMPSETKQRKAE